MELSDIKLLKSDLGREYLEKFKAFKDEDLERVMFKAMPDDRDLLRAVVTLLKLRRKARGKFSRAEHMFFSTDGQEQSTGETIARYIASRFGANKKIVDLTCSVGGNLIFLAEKNSVTAVDRNAVNLECAKLNSQVYGVEKNIEFILGEAAEHILKDAQAFFLDPERARDGKTKTRSIYNSSPKILELLPNIFAITKNVGIKISPAFDYKEISRLPEKPEIEIISEDNVCKVAMLWFGDFKTCERRATCLSQHAVFTFTNQNEKPAEVATEPSVFLFEPDKAIIKARLIDEMANEFGLQKLNAHTAFLTGDKFVPAEIFRIFKIKEYGEFSLKAIKDLVKSQNIQRVNIISRRFPVTPEEMFKKLRLKEGGSLFLIFTVFGDEKRYFVLGERLS